MRVHPCRMNRAACLLLVLLAGCSHGAGDSRPLQTQTGLATYYGAGLQGQPTAGGEVFDKNDMVAAHPDYPAGTLVRVTNTENNRAVDVRIIDRGPSGSHQEDGVIIDVSKAAAEALGFKQEGKTPVRVDVLKWGDGRR